MFGFKKKQKLPSRAMLNALEEKRRLGKRDLKKDLARYMKQHANDKLDTHKTISNTYL